MQVHEDPRRGSGYLRSLKLSELCPEDQEAILAEQRRNAEKRPMKVRA